MPRMNSNERRRIRNRIKVRARSSGRPRLVVFRSNKNMFAQLLNDTDNTVITTASTVEKDFSKKSKSAANIEAAKVIGSMVAARAVALGIKDIVFDRGGYLYNGRVKALADAAREAGLNF